MPEFALLRLVLVAAALGVLLAGCSEAPAPAKRPPPPVAVLTVEARTIPATSTFVAQTESSRQVDIVARISGYLEVLYAENELFGAELTAVRAGANRLSEYVNVYKAMGGGWIDEADKLAPKARGLVESGGRSSVGN